MRIKTWNWSGEAETRFFGPPVHRGLVGTPGGDEPFDPHAFEDIHDLLSPTGSRGKQPATSNAPAVNANISRRKPQVGHRRRPSPTTPAVDRPDSETPSAQSVSASQQWANEKILRSKSDGRVAAKRDRDFDFGGGIGDAAVSRSRCRRAGRRYFPICPSWAWPRPLRAVSCWPGRTASGSIPSLIWSALSFLILGLICMRWSLLPAVVSGIGQRERSSAGQADDD